MREFVTIHRATSEGAETVVGNNNYLMAFCHLGHNVRDPGLSGELVAMVRGAYRFEGSLYAFFQTLQDFPLYERQELFRRTGELGLPILLVWGDDDQVTPISHLDTVHDPAGPFRELIIAPDISVSPDPGVGGVTGLETWFWYEGQNEATVSVEVRGYRVTASMRPSRYYWDPDDPRAVPVLRHGPHRLAEPGEAEETQEKEGGGEAHGHDPEALLVEEDAAELDRRGAEERRELVDVRPEEEPERPHVRVDLVLHDATPEQAKVRAALLEAPADRLQARLLALQAVVDAALRLRRTFQVLRHGISSLDAAPREKGLERGA